MMMGFTGLLVRFVLYAIGAGLAGAGLATFTMDNAALCFDMHAIAVHATEAIIMVLGGSTMFGATAIWSRRVKKKGGVT